MLCRKSGGSKQKKPPYNICMEAYGRVSNYLAAVGGRFFSSVFVISVRITMPNTMAMVILIARNPADAESSSWCETM